MMVIYNNIHVCVYIMPPSYIICDCTYEMQCNGCGYSVQNVIAITAPVANPLVM